MNVFQVLELVRKNPLRYLEQKSLTLLRTLLVGYEMGAHSLGQKTSVLGELRPFSKWVAEALGFTGYAKGWCNMIKEKTGSDEKAYDEFFELLDKFRKEKPDR